MGVKGLPRRSVETIKLEVDGEIYEVRKLETPFREGVELEVEVHGKIIRVSDRQLGESDALRLLVEQIRKLR